MPTDRISDEDLAKWNKWAGDSPHDWICDAVDAVESERARADTAERLAEDRRLVNEAVNAELTQLKQIRHGDPHMFGAVLGYELGEQEVKAERDEARLWAEWLAAERDFYRTVAEDNTADLVIRLAETEGERDALKRGAEQLGKIVDRHCRDVLWMTGAHDLIGDDGDGDWAAVWERLGTIVAERDALKAELAKTKAAAVAAYDGNTLISQANHRADEAESERDALKARFDATRQLVVYHLIGDDIATNTLGVALLRALDGEAVDRG